MHQFSLIALVVLSIFASACGTRDHPETTFSLQNDSDDVKYVQDWEWFRLIVEGETVSVTDALCMPRCGELFGGQVSCAGARLATVLELQPGESVERAWDGVYYEIDEERECYRERSGNDVEVEYCWGEDFNRDNVVDDSMLSDGIYQDAWIEDPICERQVFERGDDVLLSID